MKYICQITTVFLFFFSGIFPANSKSYTQDVRGKSMGNTGIASGTLDNPSAISFADRPFVIFGYENRFNISELAEYSAGFAFPNTVLDGSTSLYRFGYEHYSENFLHVACSKKLFSRFSMGVSLNYFFVQTSEEADNQWKLTADIGLLWKIRDDLTCGVGLSNFLLTKSNASYPFQRKFRIGFSYFIAPTFELCLEYDKMDKESPFYKIGADYQIIENLFLRTGFFGKPFIPTAGLGYRMKKWRFDLAADNHPYLGLSTSIGFIYFLER